MAAVTVLRRPCLSDPEHGETEATSWSNRAYALVAAGERADVAAVASDVSCQLQKASLGPLLANDSTSGWFDIHSACNAAVTMTRGFTDTLRDTYCVTLEQKY
jgi:hypothetical protein